jgi:hypothetical protein
VSARIQSLIIAGFGLLLALILGAQLGQNYHFLPFAVAGVCIGTFIYVAFFRTVRFEALILAFLLFGYIVGNRGFAQLCIQPNSPLYLGEMGMVACLFLIGIRRALTRERVFPRIPLAWAIAAFLVIGGVRLYFDTTTASSHGFVMLAVRDSAVVYYALFFFIAYRIAQNASAKKFIERIMLVAFILLIPVAVIQIWDPDILTKVTFRGYPIIFYKGDLLTAFLGIGAFYLFLTPSTGLARLFFRSCSVASLGLMLFGSRAALTGFICAVSLLIVAKRPRFIVYQLAVGAVALLAIAFLELSNIHFESDFFRKLSDKVSSIVDISGTGHYRSSAGDNSAANNEFRTVWWTTVFNETMQKGPWVGLGFGYDLTSKFMFAYYPTGGEDTASTRSPHSIVLTVLGRMGIIGLGSFVIILYFMAKMAIVAARSVARKEQPESSLIPWCGSINLLVAALFGVVLEGPMGGILFWTFLGFACSQSPPEKENAAIDVQQRRPSKPALPESTLVAHRRPL